MKRVTEEINRSRPRKDYHESIHQSVEAQGRVEQLNTHIIYTYWRRRKEDDGEGLPWEGESRGSRVGTSLHQQKVRRGE